jgi:Rod binding domain-containing protein
MSGIVSLTAAPASLQKGGDPARIRTAAEQFEGLLLAQILRSAHEAGTGWLGSDSDSSSDCATDYAEEQLASAMAQQGGLGLAKLIAGGLERQSSRP